MIYTELISTYSVAGDVAAAILCLCFFIMIKELLYFSSDKNFYLFRHATILVFIACLSNISFYYLCKAAVEHVSLIYLTRDIYHVCVLLSLLLCIIYVGNLLGSEGNIRKATVSLAYFITGAGILFDILSPVTHFGFYRDSTGLWSDSTYVKPFTVAYILTFIEIAYMLLVYRRKIVRQIQVILVCIEVICVLIVIAQNLTDSNTYTTFTFTLPMIAILVMVHSKPLNLANGAMNADALDSLLENAKKNGDNINFMILQLSMEGRMELPEELGKTLYNFWQKHFRKAVLFNVRPGLYVLAIQDKNKDKNVESKIRELIYDVFPKYYEKFKINYWIEVLTDIDFIEDHQEIIEIVDYFISKMEKNTALFVSESQAEELKLLKRISDELDDIKSCGDLNDPRILVYAQPVKNVKRDTFDTAEALMRMEIPGLGMIYPDKFIPLAESKGCISTLSKIILNKTCAAVSDMVEAGYDLERISVNFSITELRNPLFCEEIINIIDSHNISYDKIAIELTESTNDEDYQLLYDKVHELKEYGISFYLDDFGTGYSNFERILKLDLDIVKFDRSLLLMADEDTNVKFTLKHFSQAFEELNYEILFEGVEDEEHEALCKTSHADYLQGYKYSKPIPIAQITEFLAKA